MDNAKIVVACTHTGQRAANYDGMKQAPEGLALLICIYVYSPPWHESSNIRMYILLSTQTCKNSVGYTMCMHTYMYVHATNWVVVMQPTYAWNLLGVPYI